MPRTREQTKDFCHGNVNNSLSSDCDDILIRVISYFLLIVLVTLTWMGPGGDEGKTT